jgi:hypothetical protein
MTTPKNSVRLADCFDQKSREREFCIHNLLVRIHLIIEMISSERPCAMEVKNPLPVSLISTFLDSAACDAGVKGATNDAEEGGMQRGCG